MIFSSTHIEAYELGNAAVHSIHYTKKEKACTANVRLWVIIRL